MKLIIAIIKPYKLEEVRDALAAIGCDYIQGYFYSKAVTREVFERLNRGIQGVVFLVDENGNGIVILGPDGSFRGRPRGR